MPSWDASQPPEEARGPVSGLVNSGCVGQVNGKFWKSGKLMATGCSFQPSEGIKLDRERSVADQAYEKLRKEIVSLHFVPGERLSEGKLCDWFNISRTPIRQALKKLVNEGFVESLPQFGTFVSLLSMNQLLEAQFIRESLECATTRRAVVRVNAENEETLLRLLKAFDKAVEQEDHNEFFDLDQSFHRLICEMSGMPGTWKTVEVAAAHLNRSRRLSLPIPYVPAEAAEQHREIVTAILQRDPDASEAAMRKHVRNILKILPRIKEENKEYFITEETYSMPEYLE